MGTYPIVNIQFGQIPKNNYIVRYSKGETNGSIYTNTPDMMYILTALQSSIPVDSDYKTYVIFHVVTGDVQFTNTQYPHVGGSISLDMYIRVDQTNGHATLVTDRTFPLPKLIGKVNPSNDAGANQYCVSIEAHFNDVKVITGNNIVSALEPFNITAHSFDGTCTPKLTNTV